MSEGDLRMNLDAEEQEFRAEVEAVKKWWSEPRWRYTRRPYTAEKIVEKRGNMKIQYPSNEQSKKLWGILEEKFKVWQDCCGLRLLRRRR